MNFIWFPSKNVGINVNRLQWFSLNGDRTFLTLMLAEGRQPQFAITDEDDIDMFLSLVPLMEWEEEDEAEAE